MSSPTIAASETERAGPKGLSYRHRLVIALWCVASLILASVLLGSVSLSPIEILQAIVAGPDGDPASRIVYSLRLPRTVTALAGGAALAVAGLLMQTLFANPLAGPSILGVNAGASLMVALVVLGSAASPFSPFAAAGSAGLPGALGISLAAAGGAVMVLLVLLLLARRVRDVASLLLLGVLLGFLGNGIVSILVQFARPGAVQSYLGWTYGSFSATRGGGLLVLLTITVAGLIAAAALAPRLDAFLLGEVYAESIGVPVRRTRGLLVLLAGMLAGTVTAVAGPISFVGVAAPHLARAAAGRATHRHLLPMAAVTGAMLALAADVIARLPGTSTVLPLNAVLAIAGTPVLAWVILRVSTWWQGP